MAGGEKQYGEGDKAYKIEKNHEEVRRRTSGPDAGQADGRFLAVGMTRSRWSLAFESGKKRKQRAGCAAQLPGPQRGHTILKILPISFLTGAISPVILSEDYACSHHG